MPNTSTAKQAGPAGGEQHAGKDKGRGKDASPLWLDDPEDHDYPAAASYLSLLAGHRAVAAVVQALREAPTVHHAAKDILRASRLPLLGADNVHVAKDLAKVHDGKPLSPVLLVAGDLASGRALQVADGYHRVCASHHLDEDVPVPCRIVGL